MLKRILILIIFAILPLAALSKPAKPGLIYLAQPDGTGFYARFYGDEMMRIKVTEEGSAITQDEDGWWCYAEYDTNASRISTGYKVGKSVSSDVLVRSREIPFEKLSAIKSAMKAKVAEREFMERGLTGRIRPQALTKSGSDTPIEKLGLVILVQFKGQNEKFHYTKQHFENLLMQDNYSDFGATGSAKEYFEDQFSGSVKFNFEVSDIVTLDKEMSYYGGNDSNGNDKNPHLMIMEACQLADDEINFAKYDQDGDGEVDNVFVFFAGMDEAEGAPETQIWSHAWYIKDGAGRNLFLDGVRINRYACASELNIVNSTQVAMAAIGTFCHEYSHTMGLPDLYDTDYQTGSYAASLWSSTSLMDGGAYNNNGNTPPYFNAIEREIMQLSKPVLLTTTGKYTIAPIEQGQYYRLDSDNPGEYFLFECRSLSGWDRYIGGCGMLAYHVDRSMNDAGFSALYNQNVTAADRWGSGNQVNAFAAHQCADLIEADGRMDVYSSPYDQTYQNYAQSIQGIFFPHSRANSLTPLSYPGLGCWGKATVSKSIANIAYDGNQVSFRLSRSTGDVPVPVNIKVDPYQDAAIVKFSGSFDFDGVARIELKQSGKVIRTIDVAPYEMGAWASTLEGLEPSTSYGISVYFFEDDIEGSKSSTTFMTKRQQENSSPYIYLANVKRLENGTFPLEAKLPLKLFNASKAKKITWTFNGSPIIVGPDCYYTVLRKGTLRAHVSWEDGSEEVVMKEINIGVTQDE